MMFCRRCNTDNDPDAGYCKNCGMKLGEGPGYHESSFVKLRKSDFAALILSIFLPGMGHIYMDQVKRGLIFMVAYVLSGFLVMTIFWMISNQTFIHPVDLLLFIIPALIWLYVILDIKKVMDEYNKTL